MAVLDKFSGEVLPQIDAKKVEAKAKVLAEVRAMPFGTGAHRGPAAYAGGKKALDIAGLLKIRGSEIQQRYTELLMLAGGPYSLPYVRDAMEALGPKAKPTEIQKDIKDKHNVDISTQMISTYKSNAKKGKGGKAKVGRPAKEVAPAAAGKMNIADDLILLRTLVSRLGARQMHQLIDVLS